MIGKKGADIEKLKNDVQKYTKDEVHLNIVEIRKPEIDSKLVAENIAQQLERRVAFRRVMKRSPCRPPCAWARWASASPAAGRLGGAEIARVEWYREGRVPLHTLRADIDYGVATAKTTYGTCGVKVWIFKGEIMEHDPFAHREASGHEAEGGNPIPIVSATSGAPSASRGSRIREKPCCHPSAQNSASSSRAASTALPRPARRWRSAPMA